MGAQSLIVVTAEPSYEDPTPPWAPNPNDRADGTNGDTNDNQQVGCACQHGAEPAEMPLLTLFTVAVLFLSAEGNKKKRCFRKI